MEAEGIIACIIQHESDHLIGKLFLERADLTRILHESVYEKIYETLPKDRGGFRMLS